MNDPRLEAMGDTPGSDVCGCGRAMNDSYVARALIYGEALSWIIGFAAEISDRHTGFVHIQRRAQEALAFVPEESA